MEVNFYEIGEKEPAIDHPPSKQGLIRMFHAGEEKNEDGQSVPVYRNHALIQTGEGEEFAAISRQEQRGQGWALRSALRDLWVGAAIGSHGSVRERQHKLHAHTYAAGCLVAVQHENASAVLGRAEVGDRQRWIVLPAKPTGIDPASIPDIHNHPAIRIHPDWGENQRWAWLGVEEGVAAERDAWIRAGYEIHQPSPEELEDWASFNHGEHTMLLRLKLASNLLILLGAAACH